MSKKKIKIYKVRENSDKDYINKGDRIPALPTRALIIGKSQLSGKGTLWFNLIGQKALYKNDFEPDNIYIFSGSKNVDKKLELLQEYLDIPPSNIFQGYDENLLKEVYDMIEEEYIEAKQAKEKPKHSMIILDDLSFGGKLRKKRNGIIAKMFQNGRHILLSTIITAQNYVDIPVSVRNNATAVYLFQLNRKQLESAIDDHNFLDRKEYIKIYNEATNRKKHSFMLVNYNNEIDKRYQDSEFNFLRHSLSATPTRTTEPIKIKDPKRVASKS